MANLFTTEILCEDSEGAALRVTGCRLVKTA